MASAVLVAGILRLLVASNPHIPLSGGRADEIDKWWLAARFAFRERMAPSPGPDPDIVLVVIDDLCVGQYGPNEWKTPSIAWNPFIARTLDIARISGARAVGIDRIQSERTFEWLKPPAKGQPDNDEVLLASLAKADNIVWPKRLKHDRSKINKTAPDAWIQPWGMLISTMPGSFEAPDQFVGYANLYDTGGVIAKFEPALLALDPPEVSFAVRIAERACHTTSRITKGTWQLAGRSRLSLRDDNSFLIDYAPGTGLQYPPYDNNRGPFAIYSMREIANLSRPLPGQPDPRFKDKIVLIGTTYTEDADKHFVPVGVNQVRRMSGVEIQANILRNLVRGQAIGEPKGLQLWLLSAALSLCGILLFLRLRWLPALISLAVLAGVWIAISFAVFTAARFALPINLPLLGLLLSGGLMGGYLLFSEERERRQVMNLWGQYQDPRLVEFLLENETARGGEGQEMEVTVLFADLKDFTKTVEHFKPTDAISALNRYLGMLNSVVREHGGIVDKYLGDGLMAQWGAPEVPGGPALRGHAEAAVLACLEIQEEARKLAAAPPGDGPAVTFELRLTLHTGPVVFGWVGAQRLELTIIGDTVNVTARLQETAKQLNVGFLISETTYERVRSLVVTGKTADVEIRGRDRPLRVFEIEAGSPQASSVAATPSSND